MPCSRMPPIQHPDQRVVVAVREQDVARHPRGHADEQHLLHAEPPEEPRHQQHEHDLRHLPHGHLPRRVGDADGVQKRIRERVIELQRDADQERSDDEHRERSILHQLQRVEPEHLAHADAPGRLRRRVRQQQAEHRERDRSRRSQLHRPSRRFDAHRADDEAGDDPADRAEHAHRWKLAPGIAHLPERQRVGERERRHVEQRVDEHRDVERPEGGLRRRIEQRDAAGEVQHGEQTLRREKAIGEHADEERRNHRGQRRRAVRQADLLSRKTRARPSQVPMVTYQAPQMKYSRNIITDSFRRTVGWHAADSNGFRGSGFRVPGSGFRVPVPGSGSGFWFRAGSGQVLARCVHVAGAHDRIQKPGRV